MVCEKPNCAEGRLRGALGEGAAHMACAAHRTIFCSVKLHWHGTSSLHGALGWDAAHRADKVKFHLCFTKIKLDPPYLLRVSVNHLAITFGQCLELFEDWL